MSFGRTPGDDVPDDLICPLTLEIFNDPVTLPNGTVVEREFIEKWILKHCTCPFTRAPLAISQLKPANDTKIALLGYFIKKVQKEAGDTQTAKLAVELQVLHKLIEENKNDTDAIQLCEETLKFIRAFISGDKKAAAEFYERKASGLSLSQKMLRGVAAVLIAAVGVIVGASIGIAVGTVVGLIGGPAGGCVGALIGMFKGAVTGWGIGITAAAAVTGIAAGTGAGVAFFTKQIQNKFQDAAEKVVLAAKCTG